MSSYTPRFITAAALLLTAACTMKSQETPPLTGPSEFGTSVAVQATPDVLQLDGASQSVVVVTVRDSAGQPLRNVPLRADIVVGGQIVDFGSLSSKSVVTNGDGRATIVYTAPASAGESEAIIDIAVTPVGGNYQNAIARSASIRLVPTGIRIPPSDMTPSFTFSPDAPVERRTCCSMPRAARARSRSIAGTLATDPPAPARRRPTCSMARGPTSSA
jgi:hypothetical protein